MNTPNLDALAELLAQLPYELSGVHIMRDYDGEPPNEYAVRIARFLAERGVAVVTASTGPLDPVLRAPMVPTFLVGDNIEAIGAAIRLHIKIGRGDYRPGPSLPLPDTEPLAGFEPDPPAQG